uniref:AF-9 ANC1 homology domain-containing protein n=1 Tax=Ascaris lumbricoides TaxID=6252 RepID=A0A9J2PK38_ASCLU
MGVSRAVVRLRVGHSAEVLNFRTVEGYTHKWTVFVRSAGPHQFVDCSFIRKVVFVLHPDFNNCHRVVKQPPFEVTEYGFAGFRIPIYVYFSGFDKSLRILYNMELCLERRSEVELVHAAEISELPNAVFSVIARYGGSVEVDGKWSNSQPGEMPHLPANTVGTDDQWGNCMVKVVENKIVKGQDKAHEPTDKSISESKKQLEEIFEFKQDRSLPIGALASLDGFAMMREVNRSLMEIECSRERSEMVNVENTEIGKASVINSEFVSEVDESRIEVQNEFDIVMQQCDPIEPGGIVEERTLNERHSSMGDVIDEERSNKNTPKIGGESACEVRMETGKVSETSTRESKSSFRKGEAVRSVVVTLAEVKKKSFAEFGCRKRGREGRLTAVKEISVGMRNKVEMEQNSAEMLMVEARERTRQRLEEERWEENETVGKKQQPFMAGNTEKNAVVKMCAKRKKRLFDEFDSEEERVPVDKFARGSGTIASVDESSGDIQRAVTLFTGETASDWKERKKGEEDLQNALKVGTQSEHFRKGELYLEPVVHDNARENLETGVLPMSSLTPNSGVARLVGVTNRAEAIELGVSLKTGFQKVKGWGGSRVLDQVTRGLDWRMEGGRWNTSNFTGRMSSVFLEAVEEECLVRLSDELMRMRDPRRLGAFVDAVMACDTASLRTANMTISEDGLLSFDVRGLSPSLRSRLYEICFGHR